MSRFSDRPALDRRLLLTGGLSALVAGCSTSPDLFSAPPRPAPSAPTSPPVAAAPPGDTIGTGPTRIGLILPLGAQGGAAGVAAALRNAATMALAEFQQQAVTILVFDDAGTPDGARAGAQAAIDGGAEIILGPLFAGAVSAAASVARPRGVPIIAFSTDESVASPRVYLLSFLPSSEVERAVSYAVSQGKRSYMALIPETAYGNVVDATFREVTARLGARITAIERFPADRARAQEVVQRVMSAAAQSDALFMPDPGGVAALVGPAIASSGARIQLLGTGLWSDSAVQRLPSLQGGWYAAPDAAGYRAFAGRYRARFGGDPVRIASLAYDATQLVAALAASQPAGQRYSEAVLTNPHGIRGVDGLFRFRRNGVNERGLAVLEIGNASARVIDSAPTQFVGA